jgi:Tol biopolymer transport system component
VRLVLAIALAAPAAAVGQTTIRVSVDSAGNEANGESYAPAISDDGRFVVFVSRASNLVPDDTNGVADVFVRDLATGVTTRVSVDRLGGNADRDSDYPFISSGGRWVAFTSAAANLVSGDTNAVPDTFVRDLEAGTTTRVSISTSGRQANYYSRGQTWITGDGRFVAFTSQASNLLSHGSDLNLVDDIFVRDLTTGETTCASVGSDGLAAGGDGPSISEDGRYVCFDYGARVYVRDREAGVTTTASVGSNGQLANGEAWNAMISAGGRYVVFTSRATNLWPRTFSSQSQTFVHDRLTGETTEMEADAFGGGGALGSGPASLSHDGRYVAFYSAAPNLVADDTNGQTDAFLRDRPFGTTVRASLGLSGQQADGPTGNVFNAGWGPFVTRRGRRVVFDSEATNLVADDHNGVRDVFVRNFRRTTLSSIVPTFGSEAGGDRVHLGGEGFADASATSVSFGGVAATVVGVDEDRIAVTTPPGHGRVAVSVVTADGTSQLADAYDYLPPGIAARAGNVNLGRGDRENVLLMDGLVGDSMTREVSLPVGHEISVALTSPSSRNRSRFVLYGWPRVPSDATVTRLPRNVGALVFPAPFTGGSPQPAVIWNNLGFETTLGSPTLPSQPAPALILRLAHGSPRPLVATLQGLIQDSASVVPQHVSVTNAIVLRVAP